MKKKRNKILLTGASGFLGSHIAVALVNSGYELLLTHRTQSDLWRCETIKNLVTWININHADWLNEVENFKPDIIINSAWEGVTSGSRDNWATQLENLHFQQQLLDLGARVSISKYIGLGSQAEYGKLDKVVKETDPANPSSAYGTIKLASMQIVKAFCEKNNINWYWMRLFSVFGEKESENWFIPSIIKKIKLQNSIDLTLGEQKYAYLYIEDFVKVILATIETKSKSGIYNVSGNRLISIKDLALKIRDYVNPSALLNFGALPYQYGQPMIVKGDTKKLNTEIINIESTDFKKKLIKTIDYYLSDYETI